jgi:eukaryotic-like serine/threonine-protein kinase
MAIQPGNRLGPYEILAAIGAGGMGEVYRAHDSKLGRDVALKVVPETFARDAERMARFEREAKVLASLNHTNIATIHGFEDSSGTRALVMELVEGPTLAARIKQGPIPLQEALPIAKQICEALEYAHERGIVHRDLKPSNVKVTPDDAVKVLDFGLAKALEGDTTSLDISTSPTISRLATHAGILLGTAAYMSPEQAKAKPVDRRADIWAFGCVLYEMLTGKMAFYGETVTDTLAAVITKEPDWSQLPPATPVRVRVLLHRCLQKDSKLRLRDIGDARISLDEAISGAPDDAASLAAGRAAKQPWRTWLLSGVAGVSLLVSALLAFLYFHQKPSAAQAMRFEIPLPERFNPNVVVSLSPDGRKLAFVGAGADAQSRLWVRSIDALDSQALQGTDGANGIPFWSPDSRLIAFPVGGSLKKIESSGGPPLTLCDAATALGGVWTRDDKIVFGTAAGLMQVSASGGAASPITTGGVGLAPSLLPDGHHFVYFREAGPEGAGIYVGSVDTKPEQQSSKRLLGDVSVVTYAPSLDSAIGYLLFVRGATSLLGSAGTLMAQPFDTRRLELTGEAVPIADRVSNVAFSASATDALIYLAGTQGAATAGTRGNVQGQLTWFDREGKILGVAGDPAVFRTLALSPDGKRVAFERADPQNTTNRNIWLYDFARGVTTRFTFDSGWDSYPVWSPDGSRIAFGSFRGKFFDLYQKTSNLASDDEIVFKSGAHKVPSSWSPDGRFLLYFNPVPPSHVSVLPLGGAEADRKPVLLEHSDFNQAVARFSPDGRWIAYSSDESGKDQIYVRPFHAAMGSSSSAATPLTGKWMVSKDGGTAPVWRHDGKELFYMGADGSLTAVDVSTSGVFQAGVPKTLFKGPAGVIFFDVSPDGKRFLMVAPSATSATPSPKFTVVLNWQAGLKK